MSAIDFPATSRSSRDTAQRRRLHGVALDQTAHDVVDLDPLRVDLGDSHAPVWLTGHYPFGLELK